MRADIMVKEKEFQPVTVPERASGSPVTLDLEGAQALQRRRLQEEAAARERKLMAEIEAKYDERFKKLEESFAEKEKNLVEELQGRYAAECRRIEGAAVSREKDLLIQLKMARRQLWAVILAAILGIWAMYHFSVTPKVAPQSVQPSPDVSVQAVVPVTAAAPVAVVVPAAMPALVDQADPEAAPVKITGNGGNFSRGSTSGK